VPVQIIQLLWVPEVLVTMAVEPLVQMAETEATLYSTTLLLLVVAVAAASQEQELQADPEAV
jgi:hypothetical protein